MLGAILMKPRSGYDLKKFLDTHGLFIRPKTQISQVYRTISEMLQKGWVTYFLDERPASPDAKVLSTTELGYSVFMDWLEGPSDLPIGPSLGDITARLFFAGFLSRQKLIKLLEAEIQARQEQIAKYRFRDRTITVSPAVPYDETIAKLVHEVEHYGRAAVVDAHLGRMIALRDHLAST